MSTTPLQTNIISSSPTPSSRPAGDLADLAEQINKCIANINAGAKTCVMNAIYAGEALNKAKRSVDHGEWAQWLKENCRDLSDRTAQRYMKFADNRKMLEAEMEALMKSKSATVADFTIRKAERLIAKSGSKAATAEPVKTIGGNDPETRARSCKDKFVDALRELRRNDADKAQGNRQGDYRTP